MYDRTFDSHWPADVNGLTPEMFAAHLFNRVHNPLGTFNARAKPPRDKMQDLTSLINVLREYADTYDGNWYQAVSRINRSDATNSYGTWLYPAWRTGVQRIPNAFDQIKMVLINGIPRGVKGAYINVLMRWEKNGLMYSVVEKQAAHKTLEFYNLENGPMPPSTAYVVNNPGPV